MEDANNSAGTSLDRPADLAGLRRLREQGLLSEEACRAARMQLLAKQYFREWASRHLLFLGVALLLAGVIIVFVYNWAKMDRLLKLGIAAFSMVLCACGAQVVGRHKLVGKTFVLSAAVLAGVLLAVFGQVYQTGADAYELFVAWAALIFLWVLISDFAALWFLCLVILHCAAIFYWQQVVEPSESISFDLYFSAIAMGDAATLAGREILLSRGRSWLGGKWLRYVLVLAFLFFLTLPVLAWVFASREAEGLGAISALLWLAGVGGCFATYRYFHKDVLPLTFLVLEVSIVICCLLIRGIFEGLSMIDDAGFLLSGLVVLLVVGGAAFVLKIFIAQMARESAEETSGGQGS